ncbi:MAG TPA: hypothetical protein VI653_27180 [Steroidobacteraceae bacterium]
MDAPGLTAAQFAYLFKDTRDSAAFDRARKSAKTWVEWEVALAKWNAEHAEEDDEDSRRKERWREINRKRPRARPPGRGMPFSINRRVLKDNSDLFT